MYSVIDIEGNGAGFRKESIIEIAIYRYDGHQIVDQVISLVNPEAEITPFVQKLTKITPKMVKTAPKFHELAKRIIEITEGTTLVGHNIDFDYRMLRQAYQRLGYEFRINTLDTIPIAKKLIPEAESYSLGKLVNSLGIPLTDHHRAGGDARATLDLFKVLISKDTQNEIIQKQYEHTNAKTYLNKIRDLTQDLPGEQGLLFFQNAEGKILMSDFVDDINKSAKKILNAKNKRLVAVQQNVEQIHYNVIENKLAAKLVMHSRGIIKREKKKFGLYHRNGNYLVEKNSVKNVEKPMLNFSSFTQGLKVLSAIKKNENLKDINQLEQLFTLKNRNEIWSFPGRTLGEKTFLELNKGRILSFGFYEFYTQIQSRAKLNKLKTDLNLPVTVMEDELKLALLKNEVEIYPLPT